MPRAFNQNTQASLKFGALTSDDVTITNSGSQVTNNQEDLTISCDVKFDVFGDYYVFGLPATVGNNRIYIYAQVNNTIGVNLGAGGMGTSATNLQPGSWYQLVLLVDRTNGRGRFFVDGAETKPWTSVTLGTGTANITLGNVDAAAVKSLIGNACNYRMWNRILSDQEIVNMYTKGEVSRASLIGEWLLSDGSSTVAYDTSGRGNNGTISGPTVSNESPNIARKLVDGNLITNGNLSRVPVSNTGLTTGARWIDGTSSGSTTNNLFGFAIPAGAITASSSATFDTSITYNNKPTLRLSTLDATGALIVTNYVTPTKQVLIPVLANTVYVLTAMVKTNNTNTNSTNIQLRQYNGDLGIVTTTASSFLNGTNDFTKLTVSVTTNTATRYVAILLGNNAAGNISDAWFADIILKPFVPTKRISTQDISISASGQATTPNPSIDTVTSNAGSAIGWFKVSSYNGQTLFGFYDTVGTTDAWRFAVETTTGYPFVWSVNTSAVGTSVVKPSMPVPLNQWFHLAITQTISGGNVTAKIYINGSLWGTGVRSGSDVRSNARFVVNSTALQRYAQIIAYEREITQDEVIAHYQLNTVPVNPKIKFNVSEGAGDVLYDTSGNGSNGTLGTLTWFTDGPTAPRKLVNNNLVKNGDFSTVPVVNTPTTASGKWIDGTALGSLTNDIFKYSLFSTSGTVSSMFDTSNLYLGKPSLKISTLAVSSFAEVCTSINGYNPAVIPFTNTIYLKPSTSYTISYAMKTVLNSGSTTGGAMVSVHENNGSGTRLAQTATITAINTTTDWTTYSATFTTNAGTSRAELRLQVYGHLGTGTAIMDAWFANITLTPTTPTTRSAA